MKIAYYLVHDLTRNDGVVKKIKSQISEWENLGVEVKVFAISGFCENSIIDANIYGFSGFISSRVRPNKNLLNDIDEFNPDLVYLRYDTVTANILFLAKKYKLICELNTIDRDEAKLFFKSNVNLKSTFRLLAFYLLRNRFFHQMSGLVSVTHEILNHNSIRKYQIPQVCVPNSIQTSQYPTLKSPDPSQSRIGLFFMGTPDQPWQGFDILEQLAQDLPEFDFHVVGLLKPSYSNVYYHGFLSAEKYLPIMMKCHVCIGTLALFRKNMEEACPLKIREYIANGFPIIIGYKEAMFEDHSHLPEWALEIDPRNPNLVSIREFCVRVKDRIVSNAEAFPLVDSSILEKRRVDFFDSILSQE
ncbi:hypothetical protein D0X99_19305 [Algoriphagus lacus]|uniref:Glycosyltransferase n=2 Tax=Algoriphagus lacus TaxID=2056311 RepID=A0A418PME3_9BACT|nr:hypothetical protein D0X99_19305 [Algoriphagus lacus]